MKEKNIFLISILFIFISAILSPFSAELMNKKIIWQIAINGTKIEYFTINNNIIKRNDNNPFQKCLVRKNLNVTIDKSIDDGKIWYKFLKQKIDIFELLIYPSISNDISNLIKINLNQNCANISMLFRCIYLLTITNTNLLKQTVSCINFRSFYV